ncbi:MAG: DUF3859 domain-containing protein [Rhodospirillaceae bacterium]|nr:DUF3859 domain-containing protein [Rhodospirillaceae bacterium]MCY4311899.1 DUF3859 domain-containing protein [Rhodospirillaceae bacterium]
MSLFRLIDRVVVAGIATAIIVFSSTTLVPSRAHGTETTTVSENGATVLDYGIYSHSILGYTEAPNDISGQRFTAADVRLIRQTQTILAQLDLTFGFRYRITDPKLLGRRLTITVRFPKMTNPANGKSGTKLVDHFVVTGEERRELFRFDYTWEMAEGRWLFQVLDGSTVIVEIPFRVIVGVN